MFDDHDDQEVKQPDDLGAIRDRQRKALDDEIRRTRRDQLQSRRMGNLQQVVDQTHTGTTEYPLDHLKECPSGELLRPKIIEWAALESQPELLQVFLNSIQSDDFFQQHYGIMGLRKILSHKTDQPIQQVMDHPAFFTIFKMAQDPINLHLQLEAAWCLTNMASGTTEQTHSLIQKNVIDLFVSLLKSKYSQILEQAVWGIGNIAGDCPEFRNKVMGSNAAEALLQVLQTHPTEKIRNLVVWVFSNLCRMRPKSERVSPVARQMLQVLRDVFKATTNPEVLHDCIYGLYISTTPETNELFLDSEFLLKFLQVYVQVQQDYTHQKSLLTAIHTFLGGFTSDNSNYCMGVIKVGFLPHLKNSLFIPDVGTVREVCWIFSNLSIGIPEQIHSIIAEPNLLETLAKICSHSELGLAREATWAICNLCLCKEPQIIEELLKRGILKLFKELMELDAEAKMVTLCLEALLHLLNYFSERGREFLQNFVQELIRSGVGKAIENLQFNKSDLIYFKAHMALDMFFPLAN